MACNIQAVLWKHKKFYAWPFADNAHSLPSIGVLLQVAPVFELLEATQTCHRRHGTKLAQ